MMNARTILSAALFLVTQAGWSAILSIGAEEGAPGQNDVIPVSIKTDPGEEITAIQFDVEIPEINVLELPTDTTMSADASVRIDHVTRFDQINAGQSAIITVYSPSNANLSTTTEDRILMELPVVVNSDRRDGDTTAINITNVLAVEFDEVSRRVSTVPVSISNGSFTVRETGATVTLTIDRTPDGTEVDPGEQLDYVVSVSSSGSAARAFVVRVDLTGRGATLVDGPSATGDFISASADGEVIEAGVEELTMTSTLSFSLQVDNPFPLTTPQLEIEAKAIPDPSGSNIVQTSTTDTVAVRTFTDLVVQLADRLLVDNDADGHANPSDIIRFDLQLVNNGNQAIGPLRIRQVLPTGASLVEGSINTNGVVTLDPGADMRGPQILDVTLQELPGNSERGELRYEIQITDNPPPRQPLEIQNLITIDGIDRLSDNESTSTPTDANIITVGSVAPVLPPVDSAMGGAFGETTAISGDLVAIGSPMEGNGVVRVYRIEDDGSRTLLQTISSDDPDIQASTEFGSSIAFDENGEVLVVGAPGNAPQARKGLNPAKAVVLSRLGVGGTQDTFASIGQNLTGNGMNADDRFGAAVDIDGGMIFVGAPMDESGDDNPGQGTGATYVFEVAATTQPQLSKIKLSNASQFGASLSCRNGNLVVGAPDSPISQASAGVAALYPTIADNLSDPSPTVLTTPSPNDGDEFGASVDLEGDSILVGSPSDDQGASDSGAVYRYGLDGSLRQTLLSPLVERIAGARFGGSVAVQDGKALIGAQGANAPGGLLGAGAAYLYNFNAAKGPGGTFELEQTIGAFSAATSELDSGSSVPLARKRQAGFGASVALSGGRFAIGAPASDSGTGGAAIRLSAGAELTTEEVFADGFEGP